MAVQAVAPFIWILGSPCAAAWVVGGVGAIRDFVGRNHLVCLATGWLAMAVLVYSALARDGTSRLLLVATAAPLTGLAIWVRESGRGGSDPSEQPPPGPTLERREPQPERLAPPRGRRQRGHGHRTGSRRGSIAPPSRTRSKA